MKLVKDCSGKLSSMRVGFLTCLIFGALLIVAGIFAAFMGKNEHAGTMITSGTMLMCSSGFAKSIQKKFEGSDVG